MYEQLVNNKTKLSVVGLGYVGLPLALEFANNMSVIGFDINTEKICRMQQNIDPSQEITAEKFQNKKIVFTSEIEKLKEASFHIIAVPTPIDKYNQPDLSPLLSATSIVGSILKKGDYVVYESTVYPGATEDDCIPLLEKLSGLQVRKDFKVGYSPERINPGDRIHTLTNTIKIVSGCDEEALDNIVRIYETIIKAGIHRAPSIKIAEAAKIIENTQRDVNIALMNELSIIFSRIGINTFDVLEAAGTKWNFLKFYPGLVGGHCIGVDPYYLVHKAHAVKYHPQMINGGRFVNDSMGGYIAKKTVKGMIALGKNILNSRVLVLGITFKENVADIRNSKVVDIIRELTDFGIKVDIMDTFADPQNVEREYQLQLCTTPRHDYDAIIVAVAHKSFLQLDESYFLSLTNKNSLLVDIKGIFRNRIQKMAYWSL